LSKACQDIQSDFDKRHSMMIASDEMKNAESSEEEKLGAATSEEDGFGFGDWWWVSRK
jgi:hypothetical protein